MPAGAPRLGRPADQIALVLDLDYLGYCRSGSGTDLGRVVLMGGVGMLGGDDLALLPKDHAQLGHRARSVDVPAYSEHRHHPLLASGTLDLAEVQWVVLP